MIINEQKPIEFINQCNCDVNLELLEAAILWFANGKNVARLKKIFIYGRYPAISIYEQKIHIHRLLCMYFYDRELDSLEYVHHIDGDRLNAQMYNLRLMGASEHQSQANKGKPHNPEHRKRAADAMCMARYGHSLHENKELLND